MRIHPLVVSANGSVTVTLQRQFVGDSTDATDQERINAYGDPVVNLGGTFTDPEDSTFTFRTGSGVVRVSLGELTNHPAQFVRSLPEPILGSPLPSQGPLMVVTSDPARASKIWRAQVAQRITDVVLAMRALPEPLMSLPDTSI